MIVTPDQTVPLHDIEDAGDISLVLCYPLGDFGLSGAFPFPKTVHHCPVLWGQIIAVSPKGPLKFRFLLYDVVNG